MYRQEIFNTISKIEKTCWQELTEDNVFLCYDWLKTFEESIKDPPLTYYITLVDNDKIAAASVCYLDKKKEGSPSVDNILFGRVSQNRLFNKFSFLPALMCGSKKGYGTHFLFARYLKENEIEFLQTELINIIEQIAVKNNSAVYFSNIMENESSLMKLLIKRGYYKTFSLPVNYINISWSSFQDYKKHVLKEYPSMRKSISREINKSIKSGVTLETLNNFDEQWEKCNRLIKMNHTKYNSRSEFPLKPDYFLKLKENFSRNAVVFAAEKNEDIIGICGLVKNGKEAALTYTGIDHNISKNDLTYFNLVFYEPIKYAIEAGIERLYGGNAFYTMKGRRGYKAAKTYIFYKSNSALKKYLVKVWFTIHFFWMSRKFSHLY